MRSKWKLPYINLLRLQHVKKKNQEYKLIEENNKNKKGKKKIKKEPFLFKSRNDTIGLDFLKNNIKVYNGIRYLNLLVNELHVGYKIGNFTVTKKRCIFKNTKKK